MALPHMPFYVGDYLRDTQHLTTEQHGAYLLLLMSQWQTGWLPDDQEQLARIARIEVERWPAIGSGVLPFFARRRGRLIQKRLDAERKKVLAKIQVRKMAGKCGGRAKAIEKSDQTTLANAKQKLKQTGSGSGSNNSDESIILGWKTEFEEFWAAFPKKQNRPRALAAYFDTRIQGFTHAEIMVGLPRWAESWRGQPERFIPNPAAWLEGQRFKDAPPRATNIVQFTRSLPRWGDVRYDYEQKYGKAEALNRYTEDLKRMTDEGEGRSVRE